MASVASRYVLLEPQYWSLVLVFLLLSQAPGIADNVSFEPPFEEYDLDNGLHVILSEDHSVPFVQVNIWYRVGAKDEVEGRSGFAHLFEHLMFMGTVHLPGSGFDERMEAPWFRLCCCFGVVCDW